MAAAPGGIAGGASIILVGAAPFLIYHLTRGAAPGWVTGGVAAAQVAALVWLLAGRWEARYRVVLLAGLCTMAVSAIVLAAVPVRNVGLAVAGGCHAVAYSSLLLWFAVSLRRGREPAVTGFARRLRRTMPDKVVRYTRQVTIAWCVFFAAQLGASAALLLMAPPAVWSAFVNLLNLPLLAAMVLAEFGCRLILFRHEPHTSLVDTIAALRHVRFTPAGRP